MIDIVDQEKQNIENKILESRDKINQRPPNMINHVPKEESERTTIVLGKFFKPRSKNIIFMVKFDRV